MPNYIIAYHGGNQPNSKEEGVVQMNKWNSWITSLGDAVLNPGTPLKGTKIITSCNIKDENDDANSMKGFAVIKANNFEDAIKIAKSDPFLDMNGTIRISEMATMPQYE